MILLLQITKIYPYGSPEKYDNQLIDQSKFSLFYLYYPQGN